MRRPAMNEPGHARELTFTCFHTYPLLASERTCPWLADAINEPRQILGFALGAYVFMPERVHLLVFPGQVKCEVSTILTAIKELMARKAIKHFGE